MPIQFEDPFADPTRQPQGPQPPSGSTGFGDAAFDLVASPLRGAEQFLRGVAGIGNIIPGVDYDTSGAFFGEAKTTVGKFATGVFEFAAGFVPAAGIAGRLGALASTSRIGAVARAGAAVGRSGSVAQGLAAGAVQDFISYGGQEERLSNLVQQFPGLENPITDYLAADEDDSELEGRFKNVLEGAGLGAATDLLLMGLKGLRAGRQAKLAGSDPEAAFRAAVPAEDAQGTLEAFGRRVDGDPAQAGQDAVDRARALDPELGPLDEGAIRRAAEQDAQAARGELPEPVTTEEFAEGLGIQDVDGFREALETRQAQTAEELTEIMVEKGANVSRFIADRGVAETIRAAEDVFGALPAGQKATVSAAEQLEEAATALDDIMGGGGGTASIIAQARTGAEDATRLRRNLAGQQAVALSLAEDLRKLDLDTLSDEDLGAALAPFVELNRYNRGITSEVGRTLQAQQTPAARLTQLLADAGIKNPDQARATLRRVQDSLGEGGVSGAAAAFRTLQDATTGGKVLGVVNELFINNVLGGARTLVVNGLTPAALTILTPLQNMLGGAVLRATGDAGGTTVMRTAMREIMSMRQSVSESFALARKAFKTGDSALLPGASIRDDVHRHSDVIQASTFGLDGGAVGGAIDFLGKAIRLPTRFLQGTDEFVKQMNYRMVSQGRLWERAAQQGLGGQEAAEFVADGMRKLVVDGQAASAAKWLELGRAEGAKLGRTGADLEDFAEQYARENFDDSLSDIATDAVGRAEGVTFTQRLDPENGAFSKLGYKVQDISNTVPMAKLVVPFVKTPVNIARDAGNRVDVVGIAETLWKTRGFTRDFPEGSKLVQKFTKDFASGDPRRKAEAIGRVSTGFAVAVTFASFAAEGKITGRGPSDPDQRRLLLEAGWQPYSIKTADGYVSYARLDPFATIIGTVADFHDYGRYSDETDQEGLQTGFAAAAFALANNVTNKTYLQGLGDFMGAISDTDRKLVPFLQRQTSAIVTPNLIGQLAGLDDPHMREVNAFSDRVRSRIPGMADDLPPMRNVLGEPIRRQNQQFGEDPAGALWDIMSPIAYRETSDDAVTTELANLRHGFAPPRKAIAGQDLLEFRSPSGQTAYDRWLELHGEVRVSGRTLRQELGRLIRSREYQVLSDRGGPSGPSPRVQAVRSVINRYRGVAQDQMEREYPELRRALRQQERTRIAARAGDGRDLFQL